MAAAGVAAEPHSTRGMKNQVRIRGPKPDVTLHCNSLPELETLLRKHITDCRDRPLPEPLYAQFIFARHVVFDMHDLSDAVRDLFPVLKDHRPLDNSPGRLPVPEAVAPALGLPAAKAKLKRQRAVGRAILRSIQAVDEFNYFEKEAWDTKHGDGYRFKYLCRDSYQNKDRSINKARKSDAASTAQPLATHHNNAAELSEDQSPSKDCSRLPTYDCKGSIIVKFSTSQQVVDVVYHHLPIHNATNQRQRDSPLASTPLLQNGQSRENSGDPMDISEAPADDTPAPTNGTAIATPPVTASVAMPVGDAPAMKGKKRKRQSKQVRDIAVEDSSDVDLGDLLQDFDDQQPPLPLLSPSWEPDPGDGDLWRQSVVTRVPGLKAQMKQAVRQSFKGAATAAASADTDSKLDGDSSASGSDYEGKKRKKKTTKVKAKQAAAAAAAAAAATTSTTANSAAVSVGPESDRPTRRRTKTGCWTCRSRKLKCDEQRPQCTQCARSRPPRECAFPEDGDEPPDDYVP